VAGWESGGTVSQLRYRAVVVGGPDQDPSQPTRTLQVLERSMGAVEAWAVAVLVGELAGAKVHVWEQQEQLVKVIDGSL